MSEMVRLPSGEVVHRSELDDGEQCTRCGEFVAEVKEDDTLQWDDPRIFRFEHEGMALNDDTSRRVLSPHRLGYLCPECEHEFRSEFLGDSYEGTYQHPYPEALEKNDE